MKVSHSNSMMAPTIEVATDRNGQSECRDQAPMRGLPRSRLLMPGTRPAPELGRHERLVAERSGLPIPKREDLRITPEPRDSLAVLTDVTERDGRQMSALETCALAFSDADHLAVLHAVWQGETAGLQADRYRAIAAAAPPASRDASELDTRQAKWLWRTMREAENAGPQGRACD
jgi:hypothetical protein